MSALKSTFGGKIMIDFLMPYITWQLILAVLIAYGSGWIWYSDSVLGKTWREQQPHRTQEDFDGMGDMLISGAISLILSTALIIILVDAFGKHGLLLFILAALAGMYVDNSANGGTRKKWMIDGGYVVLQYIIIGIGLMVSSI